MAPASIAYRPLTRKEYLSILRNQMKRQAPVNFTFAKSLTVASPVAGRA